MIFLFDFRGIMNNYFHLHCKISLLLFLLFPIGCSKPINKEKTETIARLTLRSLSAMVSLLNADTNCGFASDEVKNSAVVSGNLGEDGFVVFTVADCVIDASFVETDCSGDITTATGQLTATANLTIDGLVTGDPNNPVVPSTAESVIFNLQRISYINFEVLVSNDANVLTLINGDISAQFSPRFAVSASSGNCTVPTKNITFTNITYSPSIVLLDILNSPRQELNIESSNYSAQLGQGPIPEQSNSISGELFIFGANPNITGNGKIDPLFDAAAFSADYECTVDLALPESFVCL
jgi:hypothetical protein